MTTRTANNSTQHRMPSIDAPRLTTRQRRVLAGVCVICEASELATKLHCTPCSKQENAYQQQYRMQRKAVGMCLYCVYPPKPGATMCEVHLLRAAESQIETRRRRVSPASDPAPPLIGSSLTSELASVVNPQSFTDCTLPEIGESAVGVTATHGLAGASLSAGRGSQLPDCGVGIPVTLEVA